MRAHKKRLGTFGAGGFDKHPVACKLPMQRKKWSAGGLPVSQLQFSWLEVLALLTLALAMPQRPGWEPPLKSATPRPVPELEDKDSHNTLHDQNLDTQIRQRCIGFPKETRWNKYHRGGEALWISSLDD